MHNVCVAGGKIGTVSVSVKSFTWIFLVVITEKNNAVVPRPDCHQAVKLYIIGGIWALLPRN